MTAWLPESLVSSSWCDSNSKTGTPKRIVAPPTIRAFPAAFWYSTKYGPSGSSGPGCMSAAYDSTTCVVAAVSAVVPDITKLSIGAAAALPIGAGTDDLHSVVAVPPNAQKL